MANRGPRDERPNEARNDARESKDGEAPRERAEEEPGREVEIAAVELVAALARLDLEAALAYDAAARACEDEELGRRLREFASEHRGHVEALNETLEAEGVPPVTSDVPAGPVLAGLMRLTGPLGDEVIVVTLLGDEQLTNLSYDAALSYEWDADTEAMMREFQADEERHMAWLAEAHDRIGGHAGHPEDPPP
jgi:rubrerythrin